MKMSRLKNSSNRISNGVGLKFMGSWSRLDVKNSALYAMFCQIRAPTSFQLAGDEEEKGEIFTGH